MTGVQTICDAAAALRTGETTSVELVKRSIEVAEATDDLGSFVIRFDDQARAAAVAADEALAAAAEVGPLHGIPVGIKDILSTVEAPATAQSVVLDPAWSNGDAVVVARLRTAGAIVMGKTTTMEFAIGMPDASKPFPIPRNPWDRVRWAGGSSSGSGSALVRRPQQARGYRRSELLLRAGYAAALVGMAGAPAAVGCTGSARSWRRGSRLTACAPRCSR